MRKISYLLIAAILVPFLQGCPKPTPKIKEEYEVNKWVYGEMVKYYLWSEELPSFDDSDPATATQEYFDVNLRYRDNKAIALENDYYGDRFSHIKYTGKDLLSRATDTEKEYDFGFMLLHVYEDETLTKLAYLQILYVNPDGPADLAGLKRGDAFNTINGTKVTKGNVESLLSGSSKIKIAVLNRETDVDIEVNRGRYYNYPILLDTIYQDVEPKTAYLVYNHFTSGDNKAGYAAVLNEAFGRYKSAGVENLILDLRYNGGGEVENARLLASLIAPANMLGKEFMRMQRNDAVNNWEKFDKYMLFPTANQADIRYLDNLGVKNLQNADIKNLYIITSTNTASASELIIHTMKPVFRDAARTVYVVGQKTYGKNLGSITYTNSHYDWELSPICMRVYNLDKKSGYEKGISPNINGTEYLRLGGDYLTLPPLGDYEHENLLNKVFQHFSDVIPVTRSVQTRSGDMPYAVPMVPQRGLSGGTVLID